MLIVQVRVGKFKVRDVLLDGGFNVIIIFESLKKKLKLRRPQLAPFVVWMVDQWKVYIIGLIKNLKINLAGCDYKNFVIMLNMENGVEAYSMLLGQPWLKLARVHHNWGDSTFTITSREWIVMLSIIKWISINSSLRLKNLDVEFDWEEGLLEWEEEHLYNAIPKL